MLGALRKPWITGQHDQAHSGDACTQVPRNIFPGCPFGQVVIDNRQVENFVSCGEQATLCIVNSHHFAPELLQEQFANLEVSRLIVETKDFRPLSPIPIPL